MAAIIFLALGALMLYFAVEIGMRRRIAFLHDYHYQNMKEEDITPYLHLMGVGLAVVGICFVCSAVILSCQKVFFLPVLFGGLLPGIGVMLYAQYRYNGGIFSCSYI